MVIIDLIDIIVIVDLIEFKEYILDIDTYIYLY